MSESIRLEPYLENLKLNPNRVELVTLCLDKNFAFPNLKLYLHLNTGQHYKMRVLFKLV